MPEIYYSAGFTPPWIGYSETLRMWDNIMEIDRARKQADSVHAGQVELF